MIKGRGCFHSVVCTVPRVVGNPIKFSYKAFSLCGRTASERDH